MARRGRHKSCRRQRCRNDILRCLKANLSETEKLETANHVWERAFAIVRHQHGAKVKTTTPITNQIAANTMP